MKYIWVFIAFLLIENARAQILIVTNVKVSVTADSAATAREKALDQAHDLAFQKLLTESFSEKTAPFPPHDTVMNMVRDFSIDREKTTPTSYTASLTFEFDGSQVQNWLQRQDQSSNQEAFSGSLTAGKGTSLKMKASYTSLSEWQNIKKVLENFPGIRKVTILAFSSQNANIEIIHGWNMEKLQQRFLQKGLLLSPEEGSWVISSKAPPS